MSRKTDAGKVHRAVMGGRLAEVESAIQAESNIDALDREGRSALFYATKENNISVIQPLLNSGARVNIHDKNGETPLHFGARFYATSAVALLIQAGATIDARDVHGNTPLWRAVFESCGRGEIIKILLSAGASRAIPNKYGMSPEGLANSIANYDIKQFFQ